MTALAPTSVEDKFYAVTEILTVSDTIILSTDSLDRLFGELLIASKLLDKKVLFTDDNADSELIKNAKLSNYEICGKERLLDGILKENAKGDGSGECRIDLDKAFNVKGIGTVALGIVMNGTVNVHDELWHSSGKKALVRSLQSQDVDVKSAGPGTRIGIGLKNMDSDEI
ncbi:elongation factor Tu domain 2 protein, partial [mine drainage metagenome]